jgi:hypothetical protein
MAGARLAALAVSAALLGSACAMYGGPPDPDVSRSDAGPGSDTR